MHKDVLRIAACAGVLGLAFSMPRPAAAAWPTDPLVNVPLCTAAGDQCYPAGISDGGAPGEAGAGAIFTRNDYRGGDSDIYTQRLNADGSLGGDAPTPVLLSLVNAGVGTDGVKLTWRAGGSEDDAATVYRSSAGGEWTRIGEVTAAGTSRPGSIWCACGRARTCA